MNITGRVIKILPEVSGESARGPWVRGGFVIETDETYPRQVAFTAFGEDRMQQVRSLVMQSTVVVSFSPESREYNERWYTDLRVISIQPVGQGQPAAAAPAPGNNFPPINAAPAASVEPFASEPNKEEDLPF